MVRMGPPGGGGTSDDSTSNDSDSGSSGSSSGSSGSSSDGIIGSPGPQERERARQEAEEQTSDSDSSSSGSSGSSGGSSDSSTGSSDYGGGGIPDDIQDSDGSDTVGSPGPQEREEARQEAEEQIEESEPETTVGSPGPQERTRVERERQADEQNDLTQDQETQIESELGGNVEYGEDYTTSTNTFGGYAPSARERQRARQLREAGEADAAATYLDQATSERTVTSINFTDRFQREQAGGRLEDQIQEDYGVDATAGEDFEVEVTDDGVRAVPTDQLEQDIQESQQPGRRDDDIFSGLVSGVEDATGTDVPGEGSVVNVARQEDTDLTADLGPVSDVGDTLTQYGQTAQEDYIQPTAEALGPTVGQAVAGDFGSVESSLTSTQSGLDLAGRIAGATGDEEAAEELQQMEADIEEGSPGVQARTQFGEGAVGGGLGIANVPAIGGTVVDAGEFAVEGASRTAQGEGGEFAGEAGGQAAVAGARSTQAAVENPAQTAGQVVGGLATSGGAIRGAQAVGGARAGRAASFGIQPGEEIAITAARRGVPGAQRVAGAVGDVNVRSDARTLLSDDRGMAGPPRQRTITREQEVEPEVESEPAEVQVPPRSEFSSREEYAREIERAQAREQIPAREEFPTTEAYTRELERARMRVRGEDPFETTRTQEVEQEAEATQTQTEQVVRAETAGMMNEETTAEADVFAQPATQTTTPAFAGIDSQEATASEADTETTQPTVSVADTSTETATETTTETDLRSDLWSETRTDTRTDQRTELESVFETRTETRAETDIEPQTDDDGPTTRRRSPWDNSAAGIYTDFANPLTGEVEQTERDPSDEDTFPGLGF